MIKKSIIFFLLLTSQHAHTFHPAHVSLTGSLLALTIDLFSSYKKFNQKKAPSKKSPQNQNNFINYYKMQLLQGKQKIALASIASIAGSLAWLYYTPQNSHLHSNILTQNNPQSDSSTTQNNPTPPKPDTPKDDTHPHGSNNDSSKTNVPLQDETPDQPKDSVTNTDSPKQTDTPTQNQTRESIAQLINLDMKYMPQSIPTETELEESKAKFQHLGNWTEIRYAFDVENISIADCKVELYRLHKLLHELPPPPQAQPTPKQVITQQDTECGLHAVFNALLFAIDAPDERFKDEELFNQFKEQALKIINAIIDSNSLGLNSAFIPSMRKGNWLDDRLLKRIYKDPRIHTLFASNSRSIQNFCYLNPQNQYISHQSRVYNTTVFNNEKTILIFYDIARKHYITFCCRKNPDGSLTINEADSLGGSSFETFWKEITNHIYSEPYFKHQNQISGLQRLIDENI